MSTFLLEQESNSVQLSTNADAASSPMDLLCNGLTGHTLVELVVTGSSGSGDSSSKLALFGGQVDGGLRQGNVALVGTPLTKKKQKKASSPLTSSSKPKSSSSSPTPKSSSSSSNRASSKTVETASSSTAPESVSASSPLVPAPEPTAPLAPAPAPVVVDFKVGDVVEVAARTGPGQNKPGGVGRIMAVHSNEEDNGRTYDIKYVLGGREKNVAEDLLSPPEA